MHKSAATHRWVGSQLFSISAILGITVLLVASLGTAVGQDTQEQPSSSGRAGHHMGRHHGMPNADDQLKHLTGKLNLSDDQQAKLKPILEDQHKQMQQIWSDNSLSRQDRFNRMRELRESTDTQIKSVLNEDQQKKFDEMREEQRSHMRHHMEKGNQPSGGDGSDKQR